ncbi:DUF2249 domain-containing protein [Uliginosibacterium gangwonense]|uniref:DUF2249 domain-containing protein n=1 Tax=Uliginosibacterium gangwonense TaxID=392736 RepID=UPI00037C700A|nr:DUF2249 domain-containing protein [Uliginosibacterium gangwonense]
MIHLDMRGLPPCEPFERILAAVDALPPAETLEVLIHREPFPLYAWLAEHGFAHHTQAEESGVFRIHIHPAPPAA